MPERSRIRWDVRLFPKLVSTNTTLRDLALSGAPEGTVVVADEQTGGRGRLGRRWSSPPEAGFYGSLLVRPSIPIRDVGALTFVAAVAVFEALSKLGLAKHELKWPNDVLVNDRKICGILTETGFADDRIEWAVIGVGVNLTAAAIPEASTAPATALELEGVRATSVDVLGRLLVAFEWHYGSLLGEGFGAVLDRWTALAPMATGALVTVDDGRYVFEATTDGITSTGLLRVRKADGTVVELSAADVSLRAR